MEMTEARFISDLLAAQDRIPVGEATELQPEDGWAQWDLAVALQDRALATA